MSDWIWALILGFVLDLLLGDPAWLYHPVCIIGKYISWMEKKLRRRGGNLRKSAVFLTASTVLLTMAVVALILMLCGLLGRIPLLIAMALLDWMGIAITSMAKEARGVEKALGQGVAAGRTQVARIVGRDTQELSEEEIIKATVETVSENTTDGVISPLLYAAIGGPILLWGFKAASTLDSMVGYLDEKYRDIGWSSARLDDVLNYIPARLTALLMVIASYLIGLDAKTPFASSAATTPITKAPTARGANPRRRGRCTFNSAGRTITSANPSKNQPSATRIGLPNARISAVQTVCCIQAVR